LNDIHDQSLGKPEEATDFDVVLLICDLVTLTRSQIAKMIHLEVQASQPFMVHLPENILRQALLNLLLNAAQALESQPSGEICIKVEQSKWGLSIQVNDNGKGFPQELLTQGITSVRASRQSGKGLGLAMTEKFVKYLGGKIKLSNQPSHGASVTILLPDKCVATSIKQEESSVYEP
jgi:signal transduction histidine kinase